MGTELQLGKGGYRKIVYFWLFSSPKTVGSHGPDKVRMGNLGVGLGKVMACRLG